MSEEQETEGVTIARTAECVPSPRPNAPPPDLESLFREYNAMVFRTAYRVTGSLADAEDVLQTVFLRLARRAADAEPMGTAEGYLRRAAVNASVDLMRSRQNAKSVPIEDAESVQFLLDSSVSPERAMRGKEIREWLRSALARLSPRAAEIFTLRFFEGKENSEIAEILGTTPATVAVTLHRTRERIQHEYRMFSGEGR
jgi:RNA polymerase sigma-70 factor (ECF subfamily)